MDDIRQKREKARWEWYPQDFSRQPAAQLWAPIHCAKCFGYIDKGEAMRPVFGKAGEYEHATCPPKPTQP